LRGKPIDAELAQSLREWMYVNTRAQKATWALDNDDDLRLLIDQLKAKQTELVFLDVFRRLHFCDENDNTEMQGLLDRVTRIRGETGCAIGIVHHANKTGMGSIFHRIRGASAIHGFMEWGIGLTTINEDALAKDRIRKMEFLTKFGCEPDPIFVRAEGGEDAGVIRLTRLRSDQVPDDNHERRAGMNAALAA